MWTVGYRKVFEQYAMILHQQYPSLRIDGDLYPPPDYMMFLAKVLGFGKIIMILCILASFNFFAHLGVEAPFWYGWCMRNKLYSCMMIFFLCNAVEGQLLSTGAFEIMYNGELVWSKIDTGRIPQPAELLRLLESRMKY
ncbi:thioredoxin reductase-like selenoprotein T homolog CG3887 [Bacillus rossius redtenbacheri]|uniref:thioredoxin reductase-like selenoprotein T homolog CG3887 n=1 Tax=Bacillus rossius redtenbacheri TaxID=93214 RepID=UPI002FDE8A73